jgi:tetratricopeptide (TPR) repeat protein
LALGPVASVASFALSLALASLSPACATTSGPRYGAFGHVPAPAEAYAEYVQGRTASYDGDHAGALTHFRRASGYAPDDPSLRVAIAEELFADGQLPQTAEELDAILRRWPGNADAWVLRGRLAARRGDSGAAALAFEQAVALGPDDREAYLYAGATRARLGQLRQARVAYEQLLARWPDDAEGHYRLGRVLYDQKDYEGARGHLARAVTLDPDHIDARVRLARTFLRIGRGPEAAATLREAFDRSGEDPWVGEQLFRLLLASGDRQGALDLLAAIDADWRAPEARVAIGSLYLSVHHPDEALAIADGVLVRAPNSHAARLLRGRAQVQKRDRAGAIATVSPIPAEAPEYGEARALMAEQLQKNGKPAEAHALLDEARKAAPDSVPLALATAAMLEREGHMKEARAVLDAAQEARPDDRDLTYARASLEERVGDPDGAIMLMQSEVLAQDPDNVMAHNFIGYSYASRGVHLPEAETHLARALELAPDDGYVLDSWGWLLAQRGRLDEALVTLERADQIAPEEPEILLHLGEVHLRKGDMARAQEIWARALALDPDDLVRRRLEERAQIVAAPAASK